VLDLDVISIAGRALSAGATIAIPIHCCHDLAIGTGHDRYTPIHSRESPYAVVTAGVIVVGFFATIPIFERTTTAIRIVIGGDVSTTGGHGVTMLGCESFTTPASTQNDKQTQKSKTRHLKALHPN
jgi:hypothetical protein